MRKALSILLVIMVLATSVPSFATTNRFLESDLVEKGFTKQHISELNQIESIITKLESDNLMLGIRSDGSLYFENSNVQVSEILTKSDIRCLKKLLQEAEKSKAIEKKLEAKIDKYPLRSINEVRESDRVWAKFVTKTEKTSTPQEGKLKPYSTGTKYYDGGYYPSSGNYTTSAVYYVSHAVDYSEVELTQWITRSGDTVTVNNYDTDICAGGLISTRNSSTTLINGSATGYSERTHVRGEGIFGYSGSVGITLKGILSFGITAAYDYEQQIDIYTRGTGTYEIWFKYVS